MLTITMVMFAAPPFDPGGKQEGRREQTLAGAGGGSHSP